MVAKEGKKGMRKKEGIL